MMKNTKKKNLAESQTVLSDLLTGKSLSRRRTQRLFELIFRDEISSEKTKTFLLLLAKKGETADELLGCLHALQKIEGFRTCYIPSLMDTCGTGGDGKHTLNLSTLAAFVIAGAGGKIAKHGNRAISSKCGSSDLMESFGIKLDAPCTTMIQAIKSCGLGYFHAPFYHPVFARMQPLRKSLKRRTILNYLGPLANPMRLDYQLVGVSRKELVPLYAQVLAKLGRKAALVCYSLDGTDEISTTSPTSLAWIRAGKIRHEIIHPKSCGFQKTGLKNKAIHSVEESRVLSEKILSGYEKGTLRDGIIINAAFGLLLCQKARNIHEGTRLARTILDSGQGMRVLKRLKELTH